MSHVHDFCYLRDDLRVFVSHIIILMDIGGKIVQFDFCFRVVDYAKENPFPITHADCRFTSVFMEFPIEIVMLFLLPSVQ